MLTAKLRKEGMKIQRRPCEKVEWHHGENRGLFFDILIEPHAYFLLGVFLCLHYLMRKDQIHTSTSFRGNGKESPNWLRDQVLGLFLQNKLVDTRETGGRDQNKTAGTK